MLFSDMGLCQIAPTLIVPLFFAAIVVLETESFAVFLDVFCFINRCGCVFFQFCLFSFLLFFFFFFFKNIECHILLDLLPKDFPTAISVFQLQICGSSSADLSSICFSLPQIFALKS